MQIYNILTHKTSSKAWTKHPIVIMWNGFENALAEYHNVAIEEWIGRGYKNNMEMIIIDNDVRYPSWLGNELLHASHRSNLLRKKPEFYGQYGWKESHNLPYLWIK